jgi:hypothetical protein
MASADIAAGYAGERLTRRQWNVLGITMLFWLFDGYETFTLLLTLGPSLRQLLPANELSALPRVAAYLISITLFGWAVGGVLGGFISDRIGRRHTMIGAVVLYSIFTGTSALSSTWQWLALTRFLTGVGIGAEWGVGTSLCRKCGRSGYAPKVPAFCRRHFPAVSSSPRCCGWCWAARSAPRGAGCMQSASCRRCSSPCWRGKSPNPSAGPK